MKKNSITVKETLHFAFGTLLKNLFFFIILAVVGYASFLFVAAGTAAVAFAPFYGKLLPLINKFGFSLFQNQTTLQMVLHHLGPLFNISLGVLSLVVALFRLLLTLGVTRITLDFYTNGGSKISRLFSCRSLWLRGIGAAMLYSAIVTAGLVLLVVPGIYLALRFWFYNQFIIEKNAGIVQAFKQSFAITRGAFFSLAKVVGTFALLLLPFNGLFFIGVIPAYISLSLASIVGILVHLAQHLGMTYLYKKLS